MAAIGAGLLPVSVGYLIAHYLTYLIGEGQRVIVAIADPLPQGWDLTGTAFFVPSTAWLPAAAVWVVMLGAVVGGHVLGAWAGHPRPVAGSVGGPGARRAQLPLALVMVGLTTLTLCILRCLRSSRGVGLSLDGASGHASSCHPAHRGARGFGRDSGVRPLERLSWGYPGVGRTAQHLRRRRMKSWSPCPWSASGRLLPATS